ncbi:fibroleukin-like [Drosophila gunungcola]|uniref:fibroleukin-like n=1 Tax=Drosophila gunungcola TaxID=103775 RepID=UPI0022DF5814|nr:fibroleukin-like [Drosophila gunungcola]
MFKLSAPVFEVIVLCILLQGGLSSTAKSSTINEQCNAYCFSTFQPLIDPLVKNLRDAKLCNDMKILLNNVKAEIIEKDKQIQDMRSQIRFISEVNEHLKSHNKRDENLNEIPLNNIETQLNDKKNEIIEKDKQIEDLRSQISLISEVNEQLKNLNKRDESLPEFCPSGRPNGIYKVSLRGVDPFEVPCISSTPGWTVIQRRFDGSVNFTRGWEEYKDGFGDVSQEFFIGLEKLYLMTQAQPHELYIQLRNADGISRYAHYDDFCIGSANESYKLNAVGKYSGTAGDYLTQLTENNFSTFDRGHQCGRTPIGGWWEDRSCILSMLNGNYYKGGQIPEGSSGGIYWGSFVTNKGSLTFVQMMIKPKAVFI